MRGFGRGLLVGAVIIIAAGLVIFVWHPWENANSSGLVSCGNGIYVQPGSSCPNETGSGTSNGSTTGSNNTTTGSSNTTSGNQTTGNLSWSDLEGKINLQPTVASPGTPFTNVYHVGDDNTGPYTASCYGSVVFELTATDGTSYIIACSAKPTIPQFVVRMLS